MACASQIHGLSSAAWFTSAHRAAAMAPQLDHLMLFGFVAALGTVICYLHRHDSRAAMLAFAASLAATGVYGFAEGAWPLGALETLWAVNTAIEGLKHKSRAERRHPRFMGYVDLESRQARYRHIFGSN